MRYTSLLGAYCFLARFFSFNFSKVKKNIFELKVDLSGFITKKDFSRGKAFKI